MYSKKTGDVLMYLSVIAAVVAGYDSLAQTTVFGLAGTQWMLVAIILALYGIYVKLKTAD
jgi:hypothetical protein